MVDTTETNRIHELEDGLKEAERRVAERARIVREMHQAAEAAN